MDDGHHPVAAGELCLWHLYCWECHDTDGFTKL